MTTLAQAVGDRLLGYSDTALRHAVSHSATTDTQYIFSRDENHMYVGCVAATYDDEQGDQWIMFRIIDEAIGSEYRFISIRDFETREVGWSTPSMEALYTETYKRAHLMGLLP